MIHNKHINDKVFFEKEEDYIKESKQNGVKKFLCVCWDLKSSIKAIEIANKFPEVFACIGIHPEEIKNMKKDDFIKIEDIVKNNKKIMAIGEVGLDFFREK